jgi:hypothetical protein
LVLSAIEKRTAAEFMAARAEAFPKYFDAAVALSNLIQILVQPEVVERLNREFFCELEADLRDRGLASFGYAVREQAMFTVWTLRKISDLTSQMANAKIDQNQQAADELAKQCIYSAIVTRFHVHCLVISMEKGQPLNPGILDLVIDGLRAAVNAFGFVRRLLDLLVPLTAPVMAQVEWDAEDQELLAESSLDMALSAERL